MRGLLFTLISLVIFTSCSTIEDNSPALQGVRDSILFRSSDSRAVFNPDGSLVIRGERGVEALNFLISSQGQSQIIFGSSSNTNIAAYTDVDGNLFTTNSNQSSGELNYTINGDNTVSGDFKFTAFTSSFTDTVVFNRGFIYRVPILSPVIIDPVNVALQDAFTARVNTIIFNPTIISRITSGNVLTVTGQTSTTSIALSFPLNSAPGTYTFGTNPDLSARYTNQSGISNAISGQLNIVSNDQTNFVSVGEFSFNTAEGFTITDGGFTINY